MGKGQTQPPYSQCRPRPTPPPASASARASASIQPPAGRAVELAPRFLLCGVPDSALTRRHVRMPQDACDGVRSSAVPGLRMDDGRAHSPRPAQHVTVLDYTPGRLRGAQARYRPSPLC